MSGTEKKLRLFQNAISNERRSIKVETTPGNIGHSHVLGTGRFVKESLVVPVRAVLLADVLDDVARVVGATAARPASVFVKMDIENYECRAVVGSRGIFGSDPRFAVSHLLMENRFKNDVVSCPRDMREDMVRILTEGGYTPYSKGKKSAKLVGQRIEIITY